MTERPVEALVRGIRAGDRRSLARAITHTESTRADHRRLATDLLTELRAPAGSQPSTYRVGISGAPGVGKSTFIELLGLHAIDEGLRVAVLTVDPSSSVSGGSILGDKTRMGELARRPEAYIRPSPSGLTLGGVARRTRETILLCEAAGFDLIIVETVGVGQSEVAVAGMTDAFVLLLLPLGGDDLQGIKRGIMELADLILVNKADGEQIPAAQRTVADYRNALGLMRPRSPNWTPVVETASALLGERIEAAWGYLVELKQRLTESGEIEARRRDQAQVWLWEELNEQLAARLREDPSIASALDQAEADVRQGRLPPPAAARMVLTHLS